MYSKSCTVCPSSEQYITIFVKQGGVDHVTYCNVLVYIAVERKSMLVMHAVQCAGVYASKIG